MTTTAWIFTTLSVGAFLAMAGGALALLEIVQLEPLERPGARGRWAIGVLVVAFIMMSIGYVLIVATTPQPPQ